MKLNAENLNINLRHLRALQAIAQAGSFNAAAGLLGIVPSALSELVRQMEETVGAPLFDRATRPPAMTPLARDFLRDTEGVLQGMDQAIARLRQAAGLERGSLAIGASPSAIAGFLAPLLRDFLSDHPGLRFLLHDDIAERLAEMVSDGRLDMAIAGRTLQSPDLLQREILRDPVGLAIAAEDPLGRDGACSLDDIPPARLIGLDAKTGTSELLRQAGLPRAFLEPRLTAYSTVAQLCMVRAGLGIALLPRDAVQLFRDPAIRFVTLTDLDLWRRLYLLEPARRPRSAAASAFAARLLAAL